MHNKKAAIGATMTWIVATIIILFVIILFVYSSGVLGFELFGGNDSLKETNTESEQMLLALLETKIDEKTVKQLVIEEDKDSLRNLKDILNKIPVVCLGYEKGKSSTWVFFYNDVGKSNFWSTIISNKGISPIDPPKDDNPTLSVVYLSNDKVVKFYEACN